MVDTRQQRPAGYDKPTQFWSFCKFSFTPTRVVFLYVPLVINTSRSFPHPRLNTGFVTRLTRRLPLVEQELLTLPGRMSSPRVLVGFVLLDLQFYIYVLQIVVCPFVLFLLAIVLSVLFRYTYSVYPFGIFKLFSRHVLFRSSCAINYLLIINKLLSFRLDGTMKSKTLGSF